MGAKQLDLVGKVFSRLTVLKQENSMSYGKTKKRMWLCKCSCGKEIVLNTGALTSGNSKSCGCLHNELSAEIGRKSRHKVANVDAGYKSIMSSYKGNARNRNLVFDLSLDEFKELILSNCHYCGSLPTNLYSKSYYNVTYNGIDRIDNSIGYIKNNVVPCCKMCNVAKNNNSHEDFMKWILRIFKNTSMNIVKSHAEIINLVKTTPNDMHLG